MSMADYFCDNCRALAVLADTCVRLDAADPEVYAAATGLLPFAAICEHCGSPIIVPRPSIYIDHDRQFAVRLRPSGFRMPLYDGPLDYTLRDTQLLLDFREKVLLLSHGCDDVAVEFLKQQTKKANPEVNFVDIICAAVEKDHLQMQGILLDGSTLAYNSPVELYEAARAAVPDDWHPAGFAEVSAAWIASCVARREARDGQAPK